MKKILLSGAYGQVGQELFIGLASKYGAQNVICTDVRLPPPSLGVVHHEIVDINHKEHLFDVLRKYQVTDFYSLAALLSAKGQTYPLYTQQMNMGSLFNSLEAARLGLVKRVFWPSSIAAFGLNTPKRSPQHTVQEPDTAYGISKKSGELWCNYYHQKYGVDVRSVRYPGLLSWRSPPGGGTTDYAPEMIMSAAMGQRFACYLSEDTPLSMIYSDDAVYATMKLMEARPQNLTIWTSYNIYAMTFTPMELAAQVRKHFPNFEVDYKPDPIRQSIADSWPQVFVDEKARRDWSWAPKYGFEEMVAEMVKKCTPEHVRSFRPK